MANLLQLVSTGTPVALNFIKSYLASPVIGGTPVEGASKIASALTGPLKDGILIEAESYKETERADVSTQMILSVDGDKRYISDNIVVHPRTWHISGYIPAELYEVSALFAPSLKKKKAKLQKLFRSRELTWFKTRECELVEIAIESIEFDTRPSVGNKQPITLILKEIVILKVNSSGSQGSPLPNPNSKSGVATSSGSAPYDTQAGIIGEAPQAVDAGASALPFSEGETFSWGSDLPSVENPWTVSPYASSGYFSNY